jgi:hypothetical protein
LGPSCCDAAVGTRFELRDPDARLLSWRRERNEIAGANFRAA